MAQLPIPPSGVTFIDPITGGVSVQWQNYLLQLSSIGGGFAPIDAEYWVSRSDSTLTNETNLGALTTGYLKVTVAAGTATPSTVTSIPGTDVTGAALSRVNDTNVTMTLGGTPLTSLLRAVSMTLGWTGFLGLARGGTNADLSATGGTGQVLQQTSVGGAVTVGTISGGSITGAALTKTNDTNVTLTLGGSPTNALLNAASLTLGWTGTLDVTRGGIGVGTLASNGVLYGNGTSAVQALAVNSTATNKYLQQVSSGAPSWQTIPASEITSGAALTRTSDTNVTLTLGGAPTTALLAATSITAGWSGTLSLARGGTAADLSGTGGTSQVLKQSSVGGAVTVGTLASTNLSDVTEGNTFTPAITLGGAATGVTYAIQLGRYLAIGKHVFYDLVVNLSNKGSSTGTLLITTGTLPNCVNVTNQYQTCSVLVDSMAAGIVAVPQAFVIANTNVIRLNKLVTGNSTPLADTDLTNGSFLLCSGHYETN